MCAFEALLQNRLGLDGSNGRLQSSSPAAASSLDVGLRANWLWALRAPLDGGLGLCGGLIKMCALGVRSNF